MWISMLLFNMMGLVLTIISIGFGLYYLFFKKAKNRNSSILGYAYLIAGAFGLIVTMSLW
jgi:lipoprotein signal peptidase